MGMHVRAYIMYVRESVENLVDVIQCRILMTRCESSLNTSTQQTASDNTDGAQ